MADPSLVQKLLYLAGKRAPAEHRGWLADLLDDKGPRRGLLLSAPNALVAVVVALFSLLLGDSGFAIVLLILAVVILVAGALVAPLTNYRARLLARKNGITAT